MGTLIRMTMRPRLLTTALIPLALLLFTVAPAVMAQTESLPEPAVVNQVDTNAIAQALSITEDSLAAMGATDLQAMLKVTMSAIKASTDQKGSILEGIWESRTAARRENAEVKALYAEIEQLKARIEKVLDARPEHQRQVAELDGVEKQILDLGRIRMNILRRLEAAGADALTSMPPMEFQ